jgi:hypothetical protein
MDHQKPRIRAVTAIMASLVIASSVIACGGGGSASTAPGASTAATARPAPAASAAAPSDAAQPSTAAATTAPSTAAGGGGGSAAGLACDLLTVDEAGTVVGGPLASKSTPGDPSYCSYEAISGVKVLTSYAQKDAKVGYDTWASASDSVKIDGIGDGAIWVPSLATLLVLKGDRVLGITAGTGSDDETKRIDWSKALAAIAAAKM